MLDVDGFVSETNATNLFMVKTGVLVTPSTGSCLPGITRCVCCVYTSVRFAIVASSVQCSGFVSQTCMISLHYGKVGFSNRRKTRR